MRGWIAFVPLVVAGVARAQPVTHPDVEPCKVTIALAPDDVRAEIESWVNAEPRCVRELEVRVVPVDDGLYLSARDEHGRVRERLVPDAQSAAVLVVSWMADDSLGTTPPGAVVPPAEEAPTPVERPRAPAIPAIDDAESPFSLGGAPHTRFGGPRRFITVGALRGEHDSALRVQVDLLGTRWLTFGIAAGWGRDSGQARLVIGATKAFGRFSVRAQIGLGANIDLDERRDQMTTGGTQPFDPRDAMMDGGDPHGIEPHAELGVLGRIAIDRNWAIIGGPVVDASDDGAKLEGFIGVQHGL